MKIHGRVVVVRFQEHGRYRYEAVVFDLCNCHQPYVVARGKTVADCEAMAATVRPCARPGCRHLVPRRRHWGSHRVQKFCSRSCGASAMTLATKNDPAARSAWGREGRAAFKAIHRDRVTGDIYAGIVGLPHLSATAETSIKDALWAAYQRGRWAKNEARRKGRTAA